MAHQRSALPVKKVPKMNALLRFAVVAGTLVPFAAGAESIRLKFAFFASDREYAYPAVVKPFADAVTLEGKGIVEIELFPGGVLGRTYAEQAQLVLDGTADIAWVNPSLTPELFPDNSVIELPGLFRDVRETTRVYTRLITLQALKGYGDFFVIAAVGTGPLNIHMRPQTAALEHLKGKKIRTLNRTEGAVLKELGMAPELMPINRTAEAINRGAIDGATAPPAVLIDFGIARFTRYHYFLDLGTAPLLIVMNRKKFDSLPKAGQDVIRKYSGEWTAARYIQTTEAYDNPILEQLKSDPLRTVIFPSQAELESARAAFRTVIEAWTTQRPHNQELLQQVHAEIAKLRSDR
jgi:TRAP-type C4-dicarboxylate transport system substrate-binding protein